MKEKVTCSFTVERDLYNAYKSVVSANGEYVKFNLENYMKAVANRKTCDAETVLQKMEEEKTI